MAVNHIGLLTLNKRTEVILLFINEASNVTVLRQIELVTCLDSPNMNMQMVIT